MRIWVDASTLIALESIGELLVLRDLLGRIAITPPIADEVFTGHESGHLREARGSWIEVVPVRGDRKRWTALGLGIGEASLFSTPKGDRPEPRRDPGTDRCRGRRSRVRRPPRPPIGRGRGPRDPRLPRAGDPGEPGPE